MEIDIKEQEAKLKTEAQNIGEQLNEVVRQINQLQQRQQLLINEALKNQGALDLLSNLGNEPKQVECILTKEEREYVERNGCFDCGDCIAPFREVRMDNIKYCPQCKEEVRLLHTSLFHCSKCKIVWYLTLHALSETYFKLEEE